MKLSHLLLPVLAAGLFFSCASSETPAETQAEASTDAPATSSKVMEYVQLGEFRKLHVLGDVYLGSQPTEADLAHLKKRGVVSVINMRKAEEMRYDEAAATKELGMSYDHLGWNGPDELTDEIFDTFRKFMNDAKQPMLLHCASCNRVGPIWMAWRVLDQGASVEVATAEAKMAGMRTPGYEPKALDYIARNSK